MSTTASKAIPHPAAAAPAPITFLGVAAQQHMLLLFFPLKKGLLHTALDGAQKSLIPKQKAPKTAAVGGGPDPRVATGVHFSMFYGLPADTRPVPGMPVPTFQTAKGKDLLVALAIYDADFNAYISAFTSDPSIAQGLDLVLTALDETGIVAATDPTSAAFILANGGVAQNNTGFQELLTRYNFGDPTLPAAAALPPGAAAGKYRLAATFPGATVGAFLGNYPQARKLWPLPAPVIKFAPTPPAGA